MESIYIQTTMKGQGNLELATEMQKEEKNDNSQYFPSLIHAYSTVL